VVDCGVRRGLARAARRAVREAKFQAA